jgi:hypothetical protein
MGVTVTLRYVQLGREDENPVVDMTFPARLGLGLGLGLYPPPKTGGSASAAAGPS